MDKSCDLSSMLGLSIGHLFKTPDNPQKFLRGGLPLYQKILILHDLPPIELKCHADFREKHMHKTYTVFLLAY